MVQQGQVFELTGRGLSGETLWAYRYRTGGRDSRRVQRGGFVSEQDARDALERELERLRRERRVSRRLTLAELVEVYLAQHDVQPVTIDKLRYLLSKATAVFGQRRISELTSQEIAEWRMTLSSGYRFEATQALRQVLHRAVAWGMIDLNPAKVGVDNPVRRRKEQHPFESWAELEALALAIGPRYGPMVLFAAATGLRPAEWIALEQCDVDRQERVVYVRRVEDPEDGSEHAGRSFAGARTRGARLDQERQRFAAALSRRPWRLPRHPPLPPLPLATGAEEGGR
jgi:integrase